MNTEIINPTSSALTTEHAAVTVAGDRRPPLLALPELPITVRLATIDDLPFIDELQKKNSKSLGFMNRPTLEGKIKRGEILIAEEVRESPVASGQSPVKSGESPVASGQSPVKSGESPVAGGQSPVAEGLDSIPATGDRQLATSVGYLIGNDRYFKRDELGAIFQLCVEPGRRRGLVGATLLKALFERASYGCKLYCCWCAQDLEANHFWEAMGFVPVAFRTGSRNKNKRLDGQKGARIHIFWQKRIRAGDTETPYWYPHETNGGSIGEDRIVLPIDPRIHWSEVKLEVLPGGEKSAECCVLSAESEQKLIGTQNSESNTSSKLSTQHSAPSTKGKRPKLKATVEPPISRSVARLVRPQFGSQMKAEKVVKEKVVREKPAPKVKQKNDPEKVKAARYLRDRYMEEINRGDYLVSNAKYDVSRLIENVAVPVGALPVPADQKLLAA